MRTSLLINLSAKEAGEIRKRAALDERNVSGYVMFIMRRCMKSSENLVRFLAKVPILKLPYSQKPKLTAPRTTLHVYCSVEEAAKIRQAAKARKVAISHFILNCLHRYWDIEDGLNERAKERKKERMRDLATRKGAAE
jgi:hypothetical protein